MRDTRPFPNTRLVGQMVRVSAILLCLWLPMGVAMAQAPTGEDAKAVGGATASPPTIFGIEELIAEARRLAGQPYNRPQPLKQPWLPDGYDSYKRLQLKNDRALWAAKPPRFEIHALPAGWLFNHQVDLSVIENGAQRPITLSSDDFADHRERKPDVPPPPVVPLSGFRINGPLNAPGIADEIIAFQGATYFRALGERHVYGLSARGLAIGTAKPTGEEFPEFRHFWIEKPAPTSKSVKVHALLDSPSTTGAYTFVVTPGKETVVDVSATLFARRDVNDLGLAPLTSMFLLGPSNPTRVEDFRPRVHDSDGLAFLNGKNERIWRPLSNPRSLQVSSFMDPAIRGFGLIQRHRAFSGYQDLEAHYERRPSLWVEPISGFENGHVTLVEIPTEEEIHDNIVAFFRPATAAKAQQPYSFSYRLRWRDDAPTQAAGPWVSATRVGVVPSRKTLGYRFVVDYRDDDNQEAKLPVAEVHSSAGTISDLTVHANPETRGFRVSFILSPEDAELAELRLSVSPWNDRNPEIWLYRWTKRK
ncbi:MAG: glucan biosynthesis protein [Hyphomicrobiaceae bacterium]